MEKLLDYRINGVEAHEHTFSDGISDVVTANSTPRVVVVDENHAQIAFYERSVASLSVELMPFHSPEDCLEYLRDHAADLVFLDLAMSGQDGLSWLRDMRNMERHASTAVVVITSKDYAQDRVLARKLGAVDYLVKPLRSQEIRDLILTHAAAASRDDGSAD